MITWNSCILCIANLSMTHTLLPTIGFKLLIVVISKSLSPAAEFAKISALMWSPISVNAFSRRGKIKCRFKWF